MSRIEKSTMAKRHLGGQMRAILDILKSILPHAKKALPFVGSMFACVASFFLGAKWKARQLEKRYAKVCETIVQLEARIRQLEAERAPRREIKKTQKELKEAQSEKIGLERQLESLRQEP